ncbi:uncharacterized protein LOC126778271 [Nymphalis io]|uniref:uncharacterized protein LOC126778271 n=1 Tax=Inachis io TaxID=171585 RepID=UPI0021691B72|nr:uncharacterized protein LOC126778271 [Nymphalis io]
MPNCNRVKRPCKICLGTVSVKNGIQCHGACQSWVHYACLNYTPGKVKDIKAGIIKVTCPCPDCKTTLPKEYRTDKPFSCNNTKCPANHPPKCGNIACPINEGVKGDQLQAPSSCALDRCGKSCKTYSHPQLVDASQPQPIQPCAPPKYYESPSTSDSVDNCLNFKACPSGCSSAQDVPGDFGRQHNPIVPSMRTLEQMCTTAAQLTNQINTLMMKMHRTVQEQDGEKPCPQKGNKPCYCPGNPGRRKR